MDDSQKRYQEYLDFIKKYPKYLGNKGDYKNGEIEVITDIALFPKCEEGAAQLMIEAGTDPVDAKKRSLIGVRDENRWGVLVCDPLRFSNGKYGTFVRPVSWGALDSGIAGVVIAATLPDGRYIFLESYRPIVRSWCLEFPRGASDPGDSLLKNIKNELSEEIGARILEDPVKIGEIFPDSGFLGSPAVIYKAKVELGGISHNETTEAIKGLVFVPKEKVGDLLRTQKYTDSDGRKYEFKDAYTLSALALLDTPLK